MTARLDDCGTGELEIGRLRDWRTEDWETGRLDDCETGELQTGKLKNWET